MGPTATSDRICVVYDQGPTFNDANSVISVPVTYPVYPDTNVEASLLEAVALPFANLPPAFTPHIVYSLVEASGLPVAIHSKLAVLHLEHQLRNLGAHDIVIRATDSRPMCHLALGREFKGGCWTHLTVRLLLVDFVQYSCPLEVLAFVDRPNATAVASWDAPTLPESWTHLIIRRTHEVWAIYLSVEPSLRFQLELAAVFLFSLSLLFYCLSFLYSNFLSLPLFFSIVFFLCLLLFPFVHFFQVTPQFSLMYLCLASYSFAFRCVAICTTAWYHFSLGLNNCKLYFGNRSVQGLRFELYISSESVCGCLAADRQCWTHPCAVRTPHGSGFCERLPH